VRKGKEILNPPQWGFNRGQALGGGKKKEKGSPQRVYIWGGIVDRLYTERKSRVSHTESNGIKVLRGENKPDNLTP